MYYIVWIPDRNKPGEKLWLLKTPDGFPYTKVPMEQAHRFDNLPGARKCSMLNAPSQTPVIETVDE